MQYFNILSLALLPSVLAQYDYGSGSGTTSASKSSATASAAAAAVSGVHVVKVGQNGLTFEPNNLTVPVGETVEFHFWPKAHSVAQSSFTEPCQPLNQTAGFFSGPVAVASGMSPTVFSIVVNSTGPIWYYCATGSHCQSGMGGVINPPANGQRTIAGYLSAAAQAASNVTPQNVQGGKLGTAAGATASASGSSTATGSAATGSSTPGAAVRGSVPWALMAGAIGGLLI